MLKQFIRKNCRSKICKKYIRKQIYNDIAWKCMILNLMPFHVDLRDQPPSSRKCRKWVITKDSCGKEWSEYWTEETTTSSRRNDQQKEVASTRSLQTAHDGKLPKGPQARAFRDCVRTTTNSIVWENFWNKYLAIYQEVMHHKKVPCHQQSPQQLNLFLPE